MKILILLCFFMLCFVLGRILFYPNNKDSSILLSVPLFYIAFNISFSGNVYRIVGQNLKLYVNSATLLVLALAIFLFTRNSLKIDINYLFFFTILFNSIYHFFIIKDVSSDPYFLRLTLNYFSIYLCYIIASSIKKISLNNFLYAFNYLAVMNGLLGILQIITKKKLLIGDFNSSILYTEGVVDSNRVVGIAGSNNSAGDLAAILFIICLYNLFRKKDLFSFAAVLITLVFAVLTQTRIALFAIALSSILIYFLIKPLNRNQQYFKYLFASFGSAFLILFLFIDRNKITRVFFSNRGDTGTERFNQFDRAWRYAMHDHLWFGIGSGQWRSFLYFKHELVDVMIHSEYLNFWVENGIIVFLTFIFLNFYILLSILRNGNIDVMLRIFTLVLFIANFICVNFNPNQVYTLNNILFYLVFFIIYKKKNSWD